MAYKYRVGRKPSRQATNKFIRCRFPDTSVRKELIAIIVLAVFLLVGAIVLVQEANIPVGFGPCLIWKPVYNATYKASSNETAKSMLTEYLASQGIAFNASDIRAEPMTNGTVHGPYIVTYHVCGTMQYFERIRTGKAAPSPPAARSICGDIQFIAKGDQLLGQFMNPC